MCLDTSGNLGVWRGKGVRDSHFLFATGRQTGTAQVEQETSWRGKQPCIWCTLGGFSLAACILFFLGKRLLCPSHPFSKSLKCKLDLLTPFLSSFYLSSWRKWMVVK